MQLEVEAARVAHGLTVVVASPQRCCVGVAVGTRHASASVTRLQNNRVKLAYVTIDWF